MRHTTTAQDLWWGGGWGGLALADRRGELPAAGQLCPEHLRAQTSGVLVLSCRETSECGKEQHAQPQDTGCRPWPLPSLSHFAASAAQPLSPLGIKTLGEEGAREQFMVGGET